MGCAGAAMTRVVRFLASGHISFVKGVTIWSTHSLKLAGGSQLCIAMTRESVEQAVESLKGRIKEVNKESEGEFTITEAVAFGDFLLSDRPRVPGNEIFLQPLRWRSPSARSRIPVD